MDVKETQPLYLGIDGGGSKCRVRIESATGDILGQGVGGPANASYGIGMVMQSIRQATTAALRQAGMQPDTMSELIAGAGIAGLHLPKYIDALNAANHPFKDFYFTDDVYAACLGAHGGRDGAVLIIGTGFSALSVVDTAHYTIGGHGFLLGEQCSGSWIGFTAVNAVLLAFDKLGPPTVLTDILREKFAAEGLLLANALVGARAKDYGALAPLVFDAASKGDEVANGILQQSADFIGHVLRVLLKTQPPQVSLVGGIADHITDRLDADVAQVLTPVLDQPEAGAIYFAKSAGRPANIQATALPVERTTPNEQ